MDRRKFIRNSCVACLSATALASLVAGCRSTKYLAGNLGKDGLTVKKDDFKSVNDSFSSFIVIKNEALLYPVCVFRHNENEYSAVWMKCTHQGAVLQASGDVLQCPAHGSEFSNKGDVIQGPAAQKLRTFPVSVNADEIFIDLRKQS